MNSERAEQLAHEAARNVADKYSSDGASWLAIYHDVFDGLIQRIEDSPDTIKVRPAAIVK